MSRADLEITQLPKQFWDTKLADVRGAEQVPYDNPDNFYDWLTKPIPLLAVVGPPMSGRTTLAGAITRYWIEEAALHPSAYEFDEFRIYWTNAVKMMPFYQRALMFHDDDNYENILQNTHFLVLDDLDVIDEKYIPAAIRLIHSRMDERHLTIITAQSLGDLSKFGTGIMSRINQGKVVELHA